MCSFNRGNIQGTNSSKICVWCLCIYVLCLWSDWFCRLTWQRVDNYICEKSLEMCSCLWPEFDCPEATLCGWQDIKIQLLLLLPDVMHRKHSVQYWPGSAIWVLVAHGITRVYTSEFYNRLSRMSGVFLVVVLFVSFLQDAERTACVMPAPVATYK